LVGGTALFQGLKLLVKTRGIKRLLLPPLLLTSLVFAGVISYAYGVLGEWLDKSLGAGEEHLALSTWDPGWWRSSVEWVMNDGFGIAVMRGSSWVLFAVLSWAIAWYCFSIVYEALAGPFLDKVQSKLEKNWFGKDPRAVLERPTDLPAEVCARKSIALGIVGSALCGLCLFQLSWPWILLSAVALVLPFLLAMTPGGIPGWSRAADYSVWLRWAISTESRALWVGIEIAAITLFLLAILLPLNLVPLFGSLLYSALVGFGTAIGMLEIPMERRGWSIAQRFAFLKYHAMPISLFGATVGVVFAIPLLGPVIAVPAASIGGLWLLIRLDKAFLR
jgi:uncharacterized protein involved in cysteine biosynthesis